MKVALIGAHAGCHFLAMKLLEEEEVTHLYHFPSNSEIQPTYRYSPLQLNSNEEFINFFENNIVDFVILLNINNLLSVPLQTYLKNKNIPAASCNFNHTTLEWCKITGKKLLNELEIPTARSKVFNKKELFANFFKFKRPWVLKYTRDWRAGLQTIIVTDENHKKVFDELVDYGQTRFLKHFGEFTYQEFLVEEFIIGSREYSYHFISNEKEWKYLGSARDYKKFLEDDKGFNTAGMGSYSPVNINPKVHEYADKIFNHFKKLNDPYMGIMYLGIMEDVNGNPYVLEINTRPGDPEFISIALTYDKTFKLSQLFYNCANNLSLEAPQQVKEATTVRIVHSQYEDLVLSIINKEYHKKITGHFPQVWPIPPEMYVNFNIDRKFLNSIVSTSAETKEQAADKIYKFLDNIILYDYIYRKDIGYLK